MLFLAAQVGNIILYYSILPLSTAFTFDLGRRKVLIARGKRNLGREDQTLPLLRVSNSESEIPSNANALHPWRNPARPHAFQVSKGGHC
jgi:hypothetical protein